MDEYIKRFHVNMQDSDSIGVLCRGRSLEHLRLFSDNFEKAYLVGRFNSALNRLSDLLLGKQLIHVLTTTAISWGAISQNICEKFNIKDIQTTFGGGKDNTITGGAQKTLAKIAQRNPWVALHLLPPRFHQSHAGLALETTGESAVSLAAFWKPSHIWIVGLDFYFPWYGIEEDGRKLPTMQAPKHLLGTTVSESPYFDNERGGGGMNKDHRPSLLRTFKKLVNKNSDITFHLLTCCDVIESSDNLEVTHVEISD